MSPVYKASMDAGEILSKDKIKFMRTDYPSDFDQLGITKNFGKKLLKNVSENDPVRFNDLEIGNE